jgi:hypothetical protein
MLQSPNKFFDAELDELMDEVKDSITQLTATKNTESRVLRKAARDQFKKSLVKIQQFVVNWS